MRKVIFDLEADSLLYDEKGEEGVIKPGVTKIHCLCYQFEDESEVKSITDYGRMRKFFQQSDVIFVGHKIITYDIPVAKKILGVDIPYDRCIDTLSLSWYLFEEKVIHGLDAWGKEVGIEKPPIEDWQNTPLPILIHRCTEDVRINMAIWKMYKEFLDELYEEDESEVNRLLNYTTFKVDRMREQEDREMGLYLDIPRIESGIERLTILAQGKEKKLREVMPKLPIYKKKKKPVKYLNKKGELTKIGQAWLDFLVEKNIDPLFEGEVEYQDGWEEPNPNSVQQKKQWLYSLGWEPEHIKFVRDKKSGEVSQIPQIAGKLDKTEVCPSIKRLFPKEPALEEMNGLGIINHRLGILKGWMRDQIDGKIYPTASSLTSTFRWKHKTLVNAPAYNAPYAEEIRSSIIAPPGYVLIGADLAGAEDRTKRHLIYPYDPEYVLEQSDPKYDPHLDVAVRASLMTQDDADFYKEIDALEDKSSVPPEDMKKFKKLKDVRHKAKTTNFSSIYGVGKKSLARSLDISEKEAEALLNTYWIRNKSVTEYVENCKVKLVRGKNWIFNSVSKFWLPLRADKDRLSATNQSLAVYVFDIWIMFLRKAGIRIPMEYHDEYILIVKEEEVEKTKTIIHDCMRKLNNYLKLNVEMGCSVQTGHRYSECH